MNKTFGFKCFGRDLHEYVQVSWWQCPPSTEQSRYIADLTSWRELTREAKDGIVKILLKEMEIPVDFWDTKATASLLIGIFKRHRWAVKQAETQFIASIPVEEKP